MAGKNLWDQALGFLKEILERRRRSGGQRPWVRVSFVVCKDNVEDVERSVELCRELGVDEGGWCVMGEPPETVRLQLEARVSRPLPAPERRDPRSARPAAGLPCGLQDPPPGPVPDQAPAMTMRRIARPS